MPYFDWKAKVGVALRVTDHERLETELQVTLTEERIFELHEALSGVFQQAEAELRVDFPGNWTLYWKARDGESRMLLAHPEKDEWVGTVAWAQSTAGVLLGELSALRTRSGDLVLSEVSRVSGFSNLEVRVVRGG
jgi:hypothetical protein